MMRIEFQIVALVGCFVAGAFVSGLHYQAKLADVKAEYSSAAEKYQADLRSKERQYAERLAEATDTKQAEIDRLKLSLGAMRGDVERLRVAASHGDVSGTGASSCKPCQRQVGDCLRLLGEGAGLLEESGELVGKFNADREAVRKLK